MERDERRRYSRGMTETARRLRREMTPAEKRLWNLVRGRRCDGRRFLRQVPAGQYVLDFHCAEVRLVIEVDGSIHDLPEVKAHDISRQEALSQELKMTFLRLTNEEFLFSSEPDLIQRLTIAINDAALVVPAPGDRPSRRR